MVRAGASLVEIGDPAKLEIVPHLLSMDAVSVEPEQTGDIRNRGGDAPLEARVHRVETSRFTKAPLWLR